MEKNNVEWINLGELFYLIRTEARSINIEPIDERNTTLALYFLTVAKCLASDHRSVQLREGGFGGELMKAIVDAPDNKVCQTIDNALRAMEEDNFEADERVNHPLTNICFTELAEKYDDKFVGFIKFVAEKFADSRFVEHITEFGESPSAARSLFLEIAEDFSRRHPESTQYTTPGDIIDLMRELVWARRSVNDQERFPLRTVFDPACGMGRSLIHCRGKQLYGQELNPTTYTLANMAMWLDGRNAHIAWGDSLNNPTFLRQIAREEFDVAVSTPPLGVANWKKTDSYDKILYPWGNPSDGYGEWAFISQMLASVNREHGMVCTMCSAGALFRDNKEEQNIRRRVFEDNLFDAIVKLPAKSLYHSGIQVYIVVFRKGRKEDEGILYLDLSRCYKQTKRRNALVIENISIQQLYANFLDGQNLYADSKKSDGVDNSIAKIVSRTDLQNELTTNNRHFLLQPFQQQEDESQSYENARILIANELADLDVEVARKISMFEEELEWLKNNSHKA